MYFKWIFFYSNYTEASFSHPPPHPHKISVTNWDSCDLAAARLTTSAASHLTKLHFVEVRRRTSGRLEGRMAAQGHRGPTPITPSTTTTSTPPSVPVLIPPSTPRRQSGCYLSIFTLFPSTERPGPTYVHSANDKWTHARPNLHVCV